MIVYLPEHSRELESELTQISQGKFLKHDIQIYVVLLQMHHYCGYLLVNSAYHQVTMAIQHGSWHAGGYGHNLTGRCSEGSLVTIVVVQRIL